ncbi:MAG: hypothetical protein E6Q51_01250 [Methylophilus methylotrophus]|uniref:PEP-CTERM sorting domain-containing protein n=1 Tax=Methylophilus methylotrophus TaxID=17 RepID=A0A5C7WJX5_METME|nr:MAG: hypothetical protein E6Q51_01250 [Methylophilus methylotrophus]
MKNTFYAKMLLLFSMLVMAHSSYAVTTVGTILGADFVNGQTVYSQTFADGTTATFTGSTSIQKKTQDGITGVGISGGRTNGEIDIGETLTGSFSKEVIVTTLNLALLFDGPEYGDVKEVAKMLVSFADGGTASYYLTATGVHTAAWTGEGSVLSLGSGAVDGGTGAWQINNPFGFRSVDSIVFTAVKGYPKSTCPSCDNQSDYTFMSMVVTPVPESHTSAMMFAGLLMVGGLTARRMKA